MLDKQNKVQGELKKVKPIVKNKLKILIADDEEINIELLSIIIKEYSEEIFIARNGVEAVNIAREYRPDIIFMDIRMPIMDGREAICEIRKEFDINDIKIIVLTADLAYESDEKKSEFIEIGSNEVLIKPVSVEKIASTIRNVLKQEG